MAEYIRTLNIHPKKGGEFDLSFRSKDGLAHSCLGNMDRKAIEKIQEILTDAAELLTRVLTDNAVWPEERHG